MAYGYQSSDSYSFLTEYDPSLVSVIDSSASVELEKTTPIYTDADYQELCDAFVGGMKVVDTPLKELIYSYYQSVGSYLYFENITETIPPFYKFSFPGHSLGGTLILGDSTPLQDIWRACNKVRHDAIASGTVVPDEVTLAGMDNYDCLGFKKEAFEKINKKYNNIVKDCGVYTTARLSPINSVLNNTTSAGLKKEVLQTRGFLKTIKVHTMVYTQAELDSGADISDKYFHESILTDSVQG